MNKANDASDSGDNNKADSDKNMIHEIVVSYLHALEGVKATEQAIMPLVVQVSKANEKNFNKFVSDNSIQVTEKDGGVNSYYVTAEHDEEFRRHLALSRRSNHSVYQAPRALLVAMVSRYDAFIGNLLEGLFRIKPELISSSKRTITFKELMEFNSLEDARDHIINEEIEAFLRQSHPDQFSEMEQKFNIKLRENLEIWPTFVELTQRRNLLVHVDGRVSNQYIKVCKRHNVDVGSISIGDTLHCAPEYFRCSFMCLYELGVKLSQVLWRKVAPNELASADESLNEICFELLQEERYQLALRLLEFGTEVIKKHSSEF